MLNLKFRFITLISILLINYVELKSIKDIQLFGLEDRIPFRSDIIPPIHRIERNMLSKFTSKNNYNQSFSRHRVTITFFNCAKFRNWLKNEEIIVKIMQNRDYTVFQATFSMENLPKNGKNLGCSLLLDLNIFLVFDNSLMIILYRLKNEEAIENSYNIHFTRNTLYFNLEKSIYNVNEKAVLRCYVLYPDETFHRKNFQLEIGGTGRGYVVINKQRLQHNLVLELTVQFVQVVDSIIFTCSCNDASIKQIVNVLDPNNKEDSLITFINRTSLAICIGILVIVLIIIGIYLLIIGRKRRLSTDMVAYYTEMVEDDIVRLPDPILHKLTSPLRRFPLPGITNMCERPRRTTTKARDKSVDMLGLSRQEERMLQRAMYDSLKQPNTPTNNIEAKKKDSKKVKKLDDSIVTRSKSSKTEESSTTTTLPSSFSRKIVQKLKRGTRYSPMRKVPLREMLKCLEDRKTQINIGYNPTKPLASRLVKHKKKPTDSSMNTETHTLKKYDNTYSPPTLRALHKKFSSGSYMSPTIPNICDLRRNLKSVETVSLTRSSSTSLSTVRRSVGRPRLQEADDRLLVVRQKRDSNRNNNNTDTVKKSSRPTRNASILARSFWLNQSPASTKSLPLASPQSTTNSSNNLPVSSTQRPRKKPRILIYHPKIMSKSQQLSRALVATAAQRKRDTIQRSSTNVASSCKRNNNKGTNGSQLGLSNNYQTNNNNNNNNLNILNGSNNNGHSKSSNIVPPELWLDPRGRPAQTEDFIKFLIFRNTPFLDNHLKWFETTPNKRKQRSFKVATKSDLMKHCRSTVVSYEKRVDGPRLTVVQCGRKPCIVEPTNCELPSSPSNSDETTTLDNIQSPIINCPASVISSCHTQAAVEDPTSIDCAINSAQISPNELVSPVRDLCIKSPHCYEFNKSTHSMQTRHRK